ncbi:hypothetical protein Taro_040274 [Colocasia esculenta]|uniref:Uncharacterized protein n=1 Tax=Colocasia esculenta TaxID=4460 RepID=A0A843WBF7_COLES|nr:hypothetical protein [Colocasia esculenta]
MSFRMRISWLGVLAFASGHNLFSTIYMKKENRIWHLAMKLLFEEATKVLQNKLQLSMGRKRSVDYVEPIEGESDKSQAVMKTSKPSDPIAIADILKAKKKDLSECYGVSKADGESQETGATGASEKLDTNTFQQHIEFLMDIYDTKNKAMIADAMSSIDISVPSRKYDIPTYLKEWVMKDLDQKWRSWKYELRNKYFNPTLKKNEQQIPPDPRVNAEQWKRVVQTWSSNSWKWASTSVDVDRESAAISMDAYSESTARNVDVNIPDQLRF